MSDPLQRPSVATGLWLTALVTLLAVYAWTNPPLKSATLNFIPIASALAIVLAIAGMGFLMTRWLQPFRSKIDEILTCLAFGTGATGAYVFALGCNGIVSPLAYAGWIAIGFFVFMVVLIRRWLPLPVSIDWSDRVNWLSLFLLVIPLLLIIPSLTTPPVSADALEYHLMIAKVHLESGEIRHIPSLVESNYPCLASYLYMLVLPLAGDVACKGLHFWYGIGILLALGRMAIEARSKSSPLLAGAFFLSMPVVSLIVGWAWNDALFVLLVVLTVLSITRYASQPDQPQAWKVMATAGIYFGIAAWTKYTVVLYVLAFALLFLFGLMRWCWRVKHVVAFAIPVALISLLVFVKNWLFTGNPFYPFLPSVFPNPYWTAEASQFFANALRRYEIPDWHWWTYLTFPFELSLRPRLIDVHVGVIPLLLAPFLLFRSARREINVLRMFTLCAVISWLVFQTETRSLLALLAVLCCVGGVQFQKHLWEHSQDRRALSLMIGLALIANVSILAVTSYYLTRPLPHFLGFENRATFLRREAPNQRVYEVLNAELEVSKVLLVGAKRPFHLNQPVLFSSFTDPPRVEEIARGTKNRDELARKFHTLGISHIVIDWDEYDRDHEIPLFSWSPEQRSVFESFLRQNCSPVVKHGREAAYRVNW